MLSHLTITGLECKNCGNILSVKMWFLVIPCFLASMLPSFHAFMLSCFNISMIPWFQLPCFQACMWDRLGMWEFPSVLILKNATQRLSDSLTDMTTYTNNKYHLDVERFCSHPSILHQNKETNISWACANQIN